MAYELKKDEFNTAKAVFSNLTQYQLMLLSVIERNKPGRIFVDDKKNPSSAFCRLGSIFLIFAGSANNAKFNIELKKTLVNDIFPNCYLMTFF